MGRTLKSPTPTLPRKRGRVGWGRMSYPRTNLFNQLGPNNASTSAP